MKYTRSRASRAELTAAGADFLAASPEELQSLLLG